MPVPVEAKVIVLPGMGLLLASLRVMVTVAVVVPSAGTVAGEAAIVELALLMGTSTLTESVACEKPVAFAVQVVVCPAADLK